MGFSTNIVLSCKRFCLFCPFRTSLSFAGCLVQLVYTYFPNRVINRHLRYGRFWSLKFSLLVPLRCGFDLIMAREWLDFGEKLPGFRVKNRDRIVRPRKGLHGLQRFK